MDNKPPKLSKTYYLMFFSRVLFFAAIAVLVFFVSINRGLQWWVALITSLVIILLTLPQVFYDHRQVKNPDDNTSLD